VRTVDLDWRSVLVAMAAFVGLIAVTGVVRSATRSLAWIVIGTLLALALNPLVIRAENLLGGRRRAAVGVVLVGFLGAAGLVAALLVPPAVRQARDLQDELPEVAASLSDLPLVGGRLERADVPAKVERWVEDLPGRLAGDTAPLESIGRQLLGGTLAALSTILFAVTLLLDGSRVVRQARRVVPRRYLDRVDRAGEVTYRIVGRYFAGSLLVAGLAGTAVLIMGLSLGVPLAPLAAVWVTMTNLIPQIGGAAGGIPFVALAFTQGAGTGVLAAIFFLAYMQFENHVLQPVVVGKTVDLSPAATMAAALVGVSAAGVVGALVAVPTLGVAKAVLGEFGRGAEPALQ